MTTHQALTSLEDATLRFVLANAAESDGWLDLTRVCSKTARQLPDVQRAIARLVRRGLLAVAETAPHSDRWMRFTAPGVPAAPSSPPDAGPVP